MVSIIKDWVWNPVVDHQDGDSMESALLRERIKRIALAALVIIGALFLTLIYGPKVVNYLQENPTSIIGIPFLAYILPPLWNETFRVLFKQVSPWSQIRTQTGIQYFRKKEYAKANDHFAEAINYGANNADAYAYSGEATRRITLGLGGIRDFELALSNRPSHPIARTGIIALYAQNGNNIEAKANINYLLHTKELNETRIPSEHVYAHLLRAAIAFDEDPNSENPDVMPKSVDMFSSILTVQPPMDDNDLKQWHFQMCHAFVEFFHRANPIPMKELLELQHFSKDEKKIIQGLMTYWFGDEQIGVQLLSEVKQKNLSSAIAKELHVAIYSGDDEGYWARRSESNLNIEPIAPVFAKIHVADTDFIHDFIYALLVRVKIVKIHYKAASSDYLPFASSGGLKDSDEKKAEDLEKKKDILKILAKAQYYFPFSPKLLLLQAKILKGMGNIKHAIHALQKGIKNGKKNIGAQNAELLYTAIEYYRVIKDSTELKANMQEQYQLFEQLILLDPENVTYKDKFESHKHTMNARRYPFKKEKIDE